MIIKQKHLDLVREWHMKFNINPCDNVEGISDFITLRNNLFFEEYNEYFEAQEDVVEKADAITDIFYVLCGTMELLDRTPVHVKDKLGNYIENCIPMLEKLFYGLVNHPDNSFIEEKIDELFNEVNRSNHSKAGVDGLPLYREDGKILKGENYFPPNIKKVLFY